MIDEKEAEHDDQKDDKDEKEPVAEPQSGGGNPPQPPK